MKIQKMKTVLIAFILVFTTIGTAFAQIEFKEISTQDEWTELKQKAEKENKLIFLDIYATWCGPCKYLDKEVYSDYDLGKVYNDLYINTKIDGESEFGSQLARRFSLRAYPTMYYLTPEEEMIAQIVGVREAGPLSGIGETISENSEKILDYEAAYTSDNLNAMELRSYQTLLASIGQDEKAAQVAADVLPSLSEEEILDPAYKDIVANANVDMDSKVYKVLKDNKEKAMEVWGPETTDKVFSNIYNASLSKAVETEDEALLERIINEFLPIYVGEGAPNMKYARMITRKIYLANTGQWDEYQTFVLDEYNKNFEGDDKFLYQEAYELVKEYNYSREALEIASQFMHMAVEVDRNADNLMMTAYVEGVRGNFEEAENYLAEAEKMELTDQQQQMLDELKKVVEQSQNE